MIFYIVIRYHVIRYYVTFLRKPGVAYLFRHSSRIISQIKLLDLLEQFSKVKSKVDLTSNRVDENLNRLKTLIQKEDLNRAITLEKLDRQTTHLNDELNMTSSTLAKAEKIMNMEF